MKLLNRKTGFILGMLLTASLMFPGELKAEGATGNVPATPTTTPVLIPALIVTGNLSPDVADTYIPTSSFYNTDEAKEVYWRSAHKHDNGSGVMQYWYMPYDGGYLFIRPVLKSNADKKRWARESAGGIEGTYAAYNGASGTATVTTSTYAAYSKVIVCDGNSLTDSRYSSYPARLENALGDDWILHNTGYSGQTTINMASRASRYVDPHYSANRTRNILVAWEIGNSLSFGATAATSYQDYKKYCLARKAAGWQVIAVTVTPRYKHLTTVTFDDDTSQINSDMRLHYKDYADGLADVAADKRLGDASDKTYYADGVHMTDAGSAVVAEIVEAAVKRLVDAKKQ